MTYPEAFAEFKDAGFSDADADIGAREAVANLRTVDTELANKGGFIGNPLRPESNVFDPFAQPNRASGQVVMAGNGGGLPSMNYDTLRQWQAASGDEVANAAYTKPVEAGRSAMALIDAAAGDVPKSERAAIENELSVAIPRVAQLVNAGMGVKEAQGTLQPVLERAGTLARQYRFQPKTADPLSRVEWQQLSDARARLRAAESDLNDRGKRLEKPAIEKQAAAARAVIQQLEAKAQGGMSPTNAPPKLPEISITNTPASDPLGLFK